jgi:hypothetical protein
MMFSADLIAFLLRFRSPHALAILIALLLGHELRTVDLLPRLSLLLRLLLCLQRVLSEPECRGQSYCGCSRA